MTSKNIALRIMQETVGVLAKWTKVSPQLQSLEPQEQQAVEKAKSYLKWPKNQEPQPLCLLFDLVDLSQDGKEKTEQKHYCPVGAIADVDPVIPYPLEFKPDLRDYQNLVKTELEKLQSEDWQNLSLLTLFIEKYGSCLSFGESDIALIDMARSTAAVAAALAENPKDDQIALIAGDLSGIQNFIYTISSDGALKSLRARSFYLELVAEEIVQQLLEKLHLPRTSVIYAGGGNLYILAPKNNDTENKIQQIQTDFNQWLYHKFQGKIFLALACHFFPVAQVSTSEFAERWNEAIKEVNKQKSRKFIDRISDLLDYKPSYEQKCRVCHRDDTTDLKPLNPKEPDSPDACPICREMFQLGGKLLKVEAIIRSKEETIKGGDPEPITFKFNTETVHYHVFDQWKTIINNPDTTLLINDWTIEHYQFRHFRKVAPLFLADYAQKSEKEEELGKTMSAKEEELGKTMRAEEFAEKSDGIKRVGYLRMDVDNLGKIFAKGLEKKTTQNLPRIAGLSRQMTYFFKVYLNSLAKDRCANLPKGAKSLNEGDRPNLLFIYAGGDDLFISGTWNEIVDFAFDVYQAFRAYTGYNPDITLSGGISIADVKFPLYQAANESGEAEDAAKRNGRDSLGLFGEVFKWDEWLGNQDKSGLISGVSQLVNRLNALRIETNASRSFVRHLLITAQIQDQMIEERDRKIKELKTLPGSFAQNEKLITKIEEEKQDIKYYLHLPKIAYTISRLPKQIQDHPDFKLIRQALLSPKNALYFRAIATWIELLNRKESHDSNND